MKTCSCSSNVHTENKSMNVGWSISREFFHFNTEVPVCSTCQGVVLSKDIEEKLRKEAVKLYKQKYGLLQGKEIHHLRTKVLKMSRQKFADYLRVSSLSIWDWEMKERPQEKSTDELIRIKTSPEYMKKHLIQQVVN